MTTVSRCLTHYNNTPQLWWSCTSPSLPVTQAADGRQIKKKPNPARKNAIFRKALQPKSSIMCLNELQSGLKYVAEPVATIGNFCVSVEVNGQTFRGYGSTKDLAKQAAAEAALVSFVKPPPPKSAGGEPPKPEDDTTPWRTLASFAMFKLFSDWRDGRIGMCTSLNQQGYVAGMAGPVGNGMEMHGLQGMQRGFSMMQQQQPQVKDETPVPFNNVSAHLTRSVHTSSVPAKVGSDEEGVQQAVPLKPISEKKQDPVAQQTRHPVMILHQLYPFIKYTTVESVNPGTNTKCYTVTAVINEQEFSQEAPSIKKAKFMLAKTALKAVYDIDNIYGEST